MIHNLRAWFDTQIGEMQRGWIPRCVVCMKIGYTQYTLLLAVHNANEVLNHQIWWLSLNFQVPKPDSHEKNVAALNVFVLLGTIKFL